jgi:hypothetical protein
MTNVADVLRSQTNAGDRATRKLGDAQVLDRMVVSAPATRPALVQVYEPAQAQDREEVILEEFVLDGGETVTRDPRSATAAFRFLPVTQEQQDKLAAEATKRAARAGDPRSAEFLTTGQPGILLPETHDELKAGAARQAELEDREDARESEFADARAGTGENTLGEGRERRETSRKNTRDPKKPKGKK